MSKFNWKDCKETWYPDPNLRAYTCEKLISMGNPIRRLQAWQEEQVCDIQIIKSYIRSVNRSRNPFVCNVSKKWRQQSKGGRSIYDRTVASFRKNLLGSVWLAGLICACMGWWPGTRVSYTSLSSVCITHARSLWIWSKSRDEIFWMHKWRHHYAKAADRPHSPHYVEDPTQIIKHIYMYVCIQETI